MEFQEANMSIVNKQLRKSTLIGASELGQSYLPRGRSSRKSFVPIEEPVTPMRIRKANFPGLPFAPSKVVIDEERSVQITVASEFIDFLDSLNDLLKLLRMVKTKHLRSLVPLPADVIREIHYTKDGKVGDRMRQFERGLFGKTPLSQTSTTTSSPSLFSPSSISSSRQTSAQSHSKRRLSGPKKMSSISSVRIDMSKLSIKPAKPAKPIWQIVALSLDIKKEMDRLTIANHRLSIGRKIEFEDEFKNLLNKRFDVRVDEKNRQLAGHLISKNQKEISKRDYYKNLMDMFQAYSGGFESIDAWKLHVESLRPHWFKDLFVEAKDLGVVVTEGVVLAFERLARFYEVDFSSVSYSRAKMCFIVQSLPVWDISRSTVQRALDFVLRHILKSNFTDKDMDRWIAARHLVRVVIPPISMEEGMKALSNQSMAVLPKYTGFREKLTKKLQESKMVKESLSHSAKSSPGVLNASR